MVVTQERVNDIDFWLTAHTPEKAMPEVMISKNSNDKLVFYVPKKDLEETIESLEFDTPEKWGGEVVLGDGQKFYLEPIAAPKLPITLRAKRGGGGD